MSTATATATRTCRDAIAYRVLLHDTWGNARDGWEVNQSREAGTIRLPHGGGARAVIRALRDLGLVWDASRMAPLGSAMRSTPYVGGHVDLCESNGKPVGHLERLHLDPETVLRRAGIRVTDYALDVLEGRAALSGADLKGKAAKYGASYAGTRAACVAAWEAAGGCVVRARSGRLSLAPFPPSGASLGRACAASSRVYDLP